MCFLCTLWATAVVQRVHAVLGVGMNQACLHLNRVHSVLGEEAEVLHVSAPHALCYSGSGNTLAMAQRLRG